MTTMFEDTTLVMYIQCAFETKHKFLHNLSNFRQLGQFMRISFYHYVNQQFVTANYNT